MAVLQTVKKGNEFYISDLSFCSKEVQYPNAPLQSSILALHCPDDKELWYRVGKLDMSSVWNKVDENQENILFEMVTAEELQTLSELSFKYRKVILM